METIAYPIPMGENRCCIDGITVHSPDFSNCILSKSSRLLPMSGSGSEDRQALNQAISFDDIWCHCHHTCSYSFDEENQTASAVMQFVPARLHIATYPHCGAVRQWNSSGNHALSYNSVKANQKRVTSMLKYSPEELDVFCKKYNTTIPERLVQVYLNPSCIVDSYRIAEENRYCHIAEFIPLIEILEIKDSLFVGYVIEALKANKTVIYREKDYEGLIPFAYDHCGNLFYYRCDNGIARYWYYDHEYDKAYELSVR